MSAPEKPVGPSVVEQYALPQTSNRSAQTIVKFSDGTRIAVYADGKVKVGRDWTTLGAEDVQRFNFGPGKGPNGSPAASFVHLHFQPRD
jgi:hypothetical protein